jgi:hypothetical protein
MRKKVQCLSCKGTYVTEGADGRRYVHVCPPRIPEKLRRDENVQGRNEAQPGKIRAEGKGVREVKA